MIYLICEKKNGDVCHGGIYGYDHLIIVQEL